VPNVAADITMSLDGYVTGPDGVRRGSGGNAAVLSRAGVAAAFPARPFSLVKVQALALRPEDADQLDRAVDDAEPVRCPRGELHGLAGLDS
jgi:hypothetical protein